MQCDTEQKRIQRAMRGRVINKDREIETEGRRRRSRQEILYGERGFQNQGVMRARFQNTGFNNQGFNNRHAARHADQIVENGHGERVNHRRRPPPRDQEELDLMMEGIESVNRDRMFTDNPEVSGQESDRGSTSRC